MVEVEAVVGAQGRVGGQAGARGSRHRFPHRTSRNLQPVVYPSHHLNLKSEVFS